MAPRLTNRPAVRQLFQSGSSGPGRPGSAEADPQTTSTASASMHACNKARRICHKYRDRPFRSSASRMCIRPCCRHTLCSEPRPEPPTAAPPLFRQHSPITRWQRLYGSERPAPPRSGTSTAGKPTIPSTRPPQKAGPGGLELAG